MMRLFKFLTTVSCAFMLNACLQDWNKTDLEQKVEAVKKIKNIQLEPIPNFQVFDSFSYTASSSRSPFDSFITTEKQDAPEEVKIDESIPCLRPNRHRNKQGLEYFPLDALKMVGTLEEKGEIWGLIIDPNGLIHRVQVNHYMGENYGKIIAIGAQKIDLEEMHNNGTGCYITREASIASVGSKKNRQ